MPKNQTSRDRQAVATKAKIYRCGVQLINQYGYEHITVAQIAKKSGVSIGTFYHHFQSKFDLMVEIYRLGDVFFSERVPALLAQTNSLPAQVVDYFCLYAQLSLQNGIDMVRSLYVPTNQMFITHGRAMQGMLTELLQTGQQRGEFSATLPAQQITEKLFVVARGVIFDWCLHNGETDLLAEMRDIMQRQVGTYLAVPASLHA